MRVLLDECLPKKLKRELPGYTVVTVPEQGWAGQKNGTLIRLAQTEFNVFLTISVPLNLMYLRWHRASTAIPTTVAPTRPAELSLKQIELIASPIIPGFSLRRHLFWRYSLIWQKP